MAKRSITTRWFVNSFSFVAILLIIIDVGVFFVLRNYNYNAVEQYLLTEANIIHGVLMYMDEYTPEIRRTVEEFDRKNSMELMVITADGRVDLTSSGFSPHDSYDMPDYELAKASINKNGDGIGSYTGYLQNSEHYMAVTVMLSSGNNDKSAIRMVTSLDKTDLQIYYSTLFTGGVSIGALIIMLFLGLYFVKSIVSPLKQVGSAARRLAKGDFSKRMEPPKNDDEIGELCQIFNYMADELENSENIKNEFISSVSHELRTPLTAIKGWSETILELEKQNDSAALSTREKGMHIIISETQRLSEMVEELLDFSRMQNGRFTLRKSNMDILAELAEAIMVFKEKAHRENVSLVYEEPDAVAMISGDKNRIKQVFINIIDNAIKYSPEGGSVIVEAAVSAGIIEIQVSDNGCGISEADLPKVKNRFFKANNSVRGSGIGLAVADEIITMHDGSLNIESVLSEGTTVKIKLPVRNR